MKAGEWQHGDIIEIINPADWVGGDAWKGVIAVFDATVESEGRFLALMPAPREWGKQYFWLDRDLQNNKIKYLGRAEGTNDPTR